MVLNGDRGAHTFLLTYDAYFNFLIEKKSFKHLSL